MRQCGQQALQGLLLLALLLGLCGGTAATATTALRQEWTQQRLPHTTAASQLASAEVQDNDGRVRVQLFAMSKCSDFSLFMDMFRRVVARVQTIMTFDIHFVAWANARSPYGFSSMHGDNEVKGDFIYLCAQHHYPDRVSQLSEFAFCSSRSLDFVPANMRDCAVNSGYDIQALSVCAEGPEARRLLSSSASLAQRMGVSWSPTLYLNGSRVCSFRYAAASPQYCPPGNEEGFVRAICQLYRGQAPKPLGCGSY
eukprot:gnl/Hemi2/3782_TR1327_c0_g1_i1.p2 gnl/Hemi2/3782_TR1327_c0_g1~~gnl/Hemi2/3782_TR1327_c0_g1_i1.p2  ORF type:complete len:254 (-),score=75.11 gnl/Hemi2/3782_TR1327_c0_g1_i1:103-864(-)